MQKLAPSSAAPGESVGQYSFLLKGPEHQSPPAQFQLDHYSLSSLLCQVDCPESEDRLEPGIERTTVFQDKSQQLSDFFRDLIKSENRGNLLLRIFWRSAPLPPPFLKVRKM